MILTWTKSLIFYSANPPWHSSSWLDNGKAENFAYLCPCKLIIGRAYVSESLY
jgi:hypothetical protein